MDNALRSLKIAWLWSGTKLNWSWMDDSHQETHASIENRHLKYEWNWWWAFALYPTDLSQGSGSKWKFKCLIYYYYYY